jgi:organic hydroperoxide reductase OsmC/OhrA
MSSEHRIRLSWARDGAPFERNNYHREHRVTYAGGQSIQASAAVGYGGVEADVDPEQQLLGALASCHMLTFLAVAANRGYVIESYDDDAVAVLGKSDSGQVALTDATLRPRIRFSGPNVPSEEELAKLHERAHRACFIANSIKTRVRFEPAPG